MRAWRKQAGECCGSENCPEAAGLFVVVDHSFVRDPKRRGYNNKYQDRCLLSIYSSHVLTRRKPAQVIIEEITMSLTMDEDIKRWAAKHKIQGKTTVAEASRAYDLSFGGGEPLSRKSRYSSASPRRQRVAVWGSSKDADFTSGRALLGRVTRPESTSSHKSAKPFQSSGNVTSVSDKLLVWGVKKVTKK